MQKARKIAGLLLALALGATSLLARGGGGCLERGTLIDTPAGPVVAKIVGVAAVGDVLSLARPIGPVARLDRVGRAGGVEVTRV